MFGRNGRTRTAVVDRATSVKDAVADATEAIVDYVDPLAKDTMFGSGWKQRSLPGRLRAGGCAGRRGSRGSPGGCGTIQCCVRSCSSWRRSCRRRRRGSRRREATNVATPFFSSVAPRCWSPLRRLRARSCRCSFAVAATTGRRVTGPSHGRRHRRQSRRRSRSQYLSRPPTTSGRSSRSSRASWRASTKSASSTTRFSIGRRQSAGSVPNGTRRSSSSSRTAASHGSRRMERPRGASSASKRSEPVAAGSGCG